MRRVIATGSTDVGRIRQGNEDALLIGESVFAVADGMGGHLAGEVASATAVKPIEDLDGRVFSDADGALQALRDAFVAANAEVYGLADSEPRYRGMGTTLTVAMVEGRRLHLAHVGDSRAYLLRGGRLEQLTDDHTLVQHLIDEGQIDREDAANHPQRSIITRAIGVSGEVDVDTRSLELEPGDQILLCSDGLTGVVTDEGIAKLLDQHLPPDQTVQELVDRANDGGGPDNITVLLLRYEDPDAPAKETRTIAISTRQERADADWAGQLGSYGSLTKGAPAETGEEPRRAGNILGRATAIVLGLVVIVGLVVGGARFLLNQSYYVGLDGEQVVIYQGIDRELGPVSLSRVVERTELLLDDVPAWYRPTLESGRTAADLNDARRIVANAPRRDAADDLEDPADDPTADTDTAGDPTDGTTDTTDPDAAATVGDATAAP
jgi:PPM family protein phosphatase